MGGIIARFRKENTTYEVLEVLESKIKSIEEYGHSTERTQKRVVANLIFVSVGLYVTSAVLFYFYFLPQTWGDRLIYATPLFLFPVVIFLTKKLLTWYYNRKLSNNSSKLVKLRSEKKKVLEDVMDKETYKVARTILERFTEKAPVTVNARVDSQTSSTLRQRIVTPVRGQPLNSQVAVQQAQTPLTSSLQLNQTLTSQIPKFSTPMPLPTHPSAFLNRNTRSDMVPVGASSLPRPIIASNRSAFDKMVEYLIGDGPNNRYALICKQCHNHNGMAMKEEFEYLAFRCAFCGSFNAAQKQRPTAPLLPSSNEPKMLSRSDSYSTSEDEKHSGSDTESEHEEVTTDNHLTNNPEQIQSEVVSDSNKKEQ